MPRRRNKRQIRRRKATEERESDEDEHTQQDQPSQPTSDQEEETAADEDNRSSALPSPSSTSERVRSSNATSTATAAALTPKIVATPRKRKSLAPPSATARPSVNGRSMITFSPSTRTPATPAAPSSTTTPTVAQTPGSGKKGRKGFTSEEDAVILEVVQHHVSSGSNFIPKGIWNTCSSKLSYLRTPVTCKNRFYRYINKRLGSPYIDTSIPIRRSAGAGTPKRKKRSSTRRAAVAEEQEEEEEEELELQSSEEESQPEQESEEEIEEEAFLPSPVSPGSPPSSPFGGGVGLLELEEEEETTRSVAQERASRTQRDIEKNIDTQIKNELEMVSVEPRIMTAKKVRTTSRFIPDSENEDAELEERKVRRKKKRETEQAAEASPSRKRQLTKEPSREEQARKKKQKLSSGQQEKQRLNTAQIESSEGEEEEQESIELSEGRNKRQTDGATRFTRTQIELVRRIADETDKDAAVVLHALYVCSGDPDLATRYIQGENIPVWTIEDDKILQSASTSESAQQKKKKLIEERGPSQCNERLRFLVPI